VIGGSVLRSTLTMQRRRTAQYAGTKSKASPPRYRGNECNLRMIYYVNTAIRPLYMLAQYRRQPGYIHPWQMHVHPLLWRSSPDRGCGTGAVHETRCGAGRGDGISQEAGIATRAPRTS
jgi:hypothetical protein